MKLFKLTPKDETWGGYDTYDYRIVAAKKGTKSGVVLASFNAG